MAELGVILKAFSDETRMRVLRLICAQELSVSEIVEILQAPQSRISRHLGILRRAGLAADRKEGNRVYYRLPVSELAGFASAVWEATRAQAGREAFHPADLDRLEDVLAKRKARSGEYFDAVAAEWDRIRRDYIEDALPFLLAGDLLRPGSVAVDVGTGTGEVLLALARAGVRVIGVDSSDRMLAACRARLAAAGVEGVELRRGDAEALPLVDGECDIAFSSMLLHHLGDPAKGVREMARVVAPGGKVVVIDLARHDQEWAREAMADLWLGFDEPQVRRWVAQAGLTDIRYSCSVIASPAEADGGRKLRTFVAVATKPPGAEED